MTEQSIRNTTARSIRAVLNWTDNPDFQRRLVIDVRNRHIHLESAWSAFLNSHHNLDQVALDNQNADDIQSNQQLFDATEEAYLIAKGRLESRLQDQQADDSFDEDVHSVASHVGSNISNQNHQNDNDSENREHSNTENNGERVSQPQINAADALQREVQMHQAEGQNLIPPTAMESQFGLLINRLCNGLASKKENTWGEFDGNLNQWQGFHDAFKTSVHDDSTISSVFKFQLLKKSLKGRALSSFGEWHITNKNYEEAWEWLKESYAREYQTSKQILWKLVTFKKLEKNTGFLIEKLVNKTQETIRQLNAFK